MDGFILKILHRRPFKEDASVIDAINDDEDKNSRPSSFQVPMGGEYGNQEEAQIQALIKNLLKQFGDNLVAHKGWTELWLKSGPKESQLYKNLMFVLIK